MPQNTLTSRVLFRAADILGSQARLARYLQVPGGDLLAWMQGHGSPPQSVFLRCVDLIVDEDGPGATRILSQGGE